MLIFSLSPDTNVPEINEPLLDEADFFAHNIVAQEYLSDDEPSYDIELEFERYAYQLWNEAQAEGDWA